MLESQTCQREQKLLQIFLVLTQAVDAGPHRLPQLSHEAFEGIEGIPMFASPLACGLGLLSQAREEAAPHACKHALV